MPSKMKELLDGWGIPADKRGFEQAGVSRDRKYGGVAVENKSGVLFLLPNGGFGR